VSLRNGEVKVFWPDAPSIVASGSAIGAPAGSASALLAALYPDALLEALTANLDQIRGGISAADRAAKISELSTKILELEHTEESLVAQALAAGLEVHRRPTANGLALLGLALEVVPEDEMAPEELEAQAVE
jgi:hypothetical protein